LNHGDNPASAGSGDEADYEGTGDEGLRLPDPGPVADAAEDAGRTAEGDEGPNSSHQGSMARRGGGDQGGVGAYPWQDQFPAVGSNLEVVGYSWNSPIPPAAELAAYERIVAGSAKRMIDMAELAVRGPIENTAKLTDAEIEASKRGLSFAIILTAVSFIAAVAFFALAVAGVGVTAAITAGSVCLSIPVVMIIRSFITRS
jgi:uncharacterized membrane protein